MSVTIKEIAWLAGLLEGEANFSVRQGGKNNTRLTPRITIEMSDEDIIVRARTLMSPASKIHTRIRGTYKPTYTFDIHGNMAIEWMMTIYSLMGRRRKERIREIVMQWKQLSKPQSQLNKRNYNKLFKRGLDQLKQNGYVVQ